MRSSPEDQRQKLNLLKPRRPASLASRPIARISSSPLRKLGIFVAAFLSGLGLTAIASALQHQMPTQPEKKQTNSATIKSHQSTVNTPKNTESYVQINDEIIPLENGVISRSYTTPSGAHVDLNVRSENTETTHSSNVTLHSTSSTNENQERGSP